MTANKRFKRRVRARAAKTGETYTAALRHFRQNPKGQTMEDNMQDVLEQVAIGRLSAAGAYRELRRFRDEQSIGAMVRRVELSGRFLNVDIEVDPQLDHIVGEPGPGWALSRDGEDLFITGPGFAHGADEKVTDANGNEVFARRTEGWGSCVVRLRVPLGVRLGGEMMAWRIVTPGVKMGRHWVFAEHDSIGSESDELDDPYRKALAELATGAIDVDQAAGRLRGIRSHH